MSAGMVRGRAIHPSDCECDGPLIEFRKMPDLYTVAWFMLRMASLRASAAFRPPNIP